jgi:hypothetical protein
MKDEEVIEFKVVGKWYLDVCYSETGLEHVIGYLTDTNTGACTAAAVFQPTGDVAFRLSTLTEWQRTQKKPLPASVQKRLFSMMKRIARKLRATSTVKE